MGKRKQGPATGPGQNASAFSRMNFLLQASALLSQQSGLKAFPALLARHASGISQKMVLRLDPGMKRMLCKRCGSVLIPGQTCRLEIDGGVDDSDTPAKGITMECLICAKQRKLLNEPGKVLFNDKRCPDPFDLPPTAFTASIKEAQDTYVDQT